MRVHVRVPATSANLGPGFDVFGLALCLHNEVVLEEAVGVTVGIEGEDRVRALRQCRIDPAGDRKTYHQRAAALEQGATGCVKMLRHAGPRGASWSASKGQAYAQEQAGGKGGTIRLTLRYLELVRGMFEWL